MESKRKFKKISGAGAYVLLGILTLFACWLFCLRFGMFGAKVDWISQHSVLPDYFRRQFYATGELFPEFAANIGGGQNIYKFSYYGLLSPAVVLSYLFPFVKMSDYLMAVQMVSLFASAALLFWWLSGGSGEGSGRSEGNGKGYGKSEGTVGHNGKSDRKSGLGQKIGFLAAAIFLLAGPMVYHSYNQIMFVNYMPFLCLGFLGVDRHMEKKKSGLLTVSVFLMIMTSFYFSIGGMLSLGLYGVHRYIGKREALRSPDRSGESISARSSAGSGDYASVWLAKEEEGGELRIFLKEGIRFLVPFFLAVLTSGVLLIPTAAAMAGREGSSRNMTAAALLTPELSFGRFFYLPYGIGLTTFAFTALLAMMFSKKWSERVLAWGCMIIFTVPVFACLLNGGLYVRNKVMIPFLPLLCYVMASYVRTLESTKSHGGESAKERVGKNLCGLLPYAATLCLVSSQVSRQSLGRYGKYVIIDGILMLLGYVVYCIRRNVLVLLLPPILLLLVFGNGYHREAGKYLEKGFYEKVTDERIGKLMKKATEGERRFYRTEQLGTEEETAANLNRVWDTGQYISSVYSSLYHQKYQNFRKEFGVEEPYRNFLMQPAVENPVFRRFMGVKYLVAQEGVQKEISGYSLAAEEGPWKLYENPSVSPAVYATDQVMGEKEYKRLELPENQLSLLRCAVIKEDEKSRKAEETAGGKKEKGYAAIEATLPEEIDSSKKQTVNVDIPDSVFFQDPSAGNAPETVLFLKFGVKNLKPSRDVTVWAEGQRNKLTSNRHFYYNQNTIFTYAVPVKQGKSMIQIVFGEGHYKILDVQCYLAALPAKEEAERLYQSAFLPDKDKTGGNVIAGGIEVKNTGYLVTTIPYEDNFEISVDGEKVKAEPVNTAFLGCRIGKGRHKIEITYHAPGMKAGKAVSLLGILLFLGSHQMMTNAHIHGKMKQENDKGQKG